MAEHFELLVRDRTPDQVAAAARTGGVRFYRAGLHLRVHGDRIRARYATGGRYDLPPVLRARLESVPGGTRIVGRLRWWSSHLFTGIFWFAALLMAGTAFLVGRTGGPGGAVAFCAISAFVLALVAVGIMAGNALAGQRDRDRLSDALLRAVKG